MAESEISLKITCVGDGYVGKTSLLLSYAHGKFPQNYLPTVFENETIRTTIKNRIYTLNLYDTAGQEDWDTLRVLAYPTTDIILLCFTVAAPDSMRNVKDKWIPELAKHIPEVPIVLVGTKCDLRDSASANESNASVKNKKFISTAEGEKLRREIKAFQYIECSASASININKVFETCVDAYNRTKVGKPSNRPNFFRSLFSCFPGRANN